MSDQNKETTRLLNDINSNIKMLCKITALSLKKDTSLQEKKKETKQDQIKVLDELNLPDSIIALIIGSTPGSVQNARSLIKAKAKKTAQVKETEVKDNEQQHL